MEEFTDRQIVLFVIALLFAGGFLSWGTFTVLQKTF
jgi:hypothetical protein